MLCSVCLPASSDGSAGRAGDEKRGAELISREESTAQELLSPSPVSCPVTLLLLSPQEDSHRNPVSALHRHAFASDPRWRSSERGTTQSPLSPCLRQQRSQNNGAFSFPHNALLQMNTLSLFRCTARLSHASRTTGMLTESSDHDTGDLQEPPEAACKRQLVY